jgi:hypothetical protein
MGELADGTITLQALFIKWEEKTESLDNSSRKKNLQITYTRSYFFSQKSSGNF